ncbi:MAG: sigma factor [Bacteroidales bacterium]
MQIISKKSNPIICTKNNEDVFVFTDGIQKHILKSEQKYAGKTELIWNELYHDLERFIFSRVKEREITNDILQDVFIKIHTNIETLTNESKLSSWMYQISRNTIHDYFRKLKPHVCQ